MNPYDVLLVEDNAADVRLTEVALREAEAPVRVSSVGDGVEAMRFLRREGQYADAPRPHLVLLDLRMPRKNGHEVLAEMKADEQLRAIPVIVFTSSDAEPDVAKAYAGYANGYVRKPIGLGAYIDVMRSVADFWLRTVRLPG